MTTAIKIENLSKQYRLGIVGTGTLSHDLKRWWHLVRGKEDPFLKIGEVNDRSIKGNSQYIWALKDINFEVRQGEVLGIIGKNGAGKSTLLKILSKVTAPTTGCITYQGRIASLLEVGTGFHPELTGRENIYLNGAILGMRKQEINRKFDEMVDFSGCERYIDTPVKRYSSGMTVRLGFAVAAFLEPEILVVDEVLAVGDAEFQKKAIGKMQDVSRNDGRTVLFVSHNMAAVKSLCKHGIILRNGQMIFEGGIDQAVSSYIKGDSETSNYKKWENPEFFNEDFALAEIGIKSRLKDYTQEMSIEDELVFTASYFVKTNKKRLDLTLHFKDDHGNPIFSTGSAHDKMELKNEAGLYTVTAILPANFFNWGNFYIDVYVVENMQRSILRINDILSFTLINSEIPLGQFMGKEPGSILPRFSWEKEKH